MIDVEKNLLTTVLIGITAFCGVVLVLFGGLYALTDIKFISKADEGPMVFGDVKAPDSGLAELAAYVAIIEKPVFFPDRQLPEIGLDSDEAVAEEEAPVIQEPIEPLRASVAGIIITPEEKIAMVNDEAIGKVVVLREGMRLPGDQSSWQLDEIIDRATHFSARDGRKATLELKVKTDGLDTNRQTTMAGGQTAGGGTQDVSRAEMIRQRVAERRAELQRRANRRSNKDEDDDDDNDGK